MFIEGEQRDGKSYFLRASIERALSATTGVALNLSTDRLSAKDPAYSTTGWRAGLFAWRDVGRTTLTAGAELASSGRTVGTPA